MMCGIRLEVKVNINKSVKNNNVTVGAATKAKITFVEEKNVLRALRNNKETH